MAENINVSNAAPPAADPSAELIETSNKASTQYALRNYSEAADLYSEACQLQDEINGEMSPENAELLFLYGRALYKVAIAKSDVLGGKVAAEKKKEAPKSKAATSAGTGASEDKLAGEVVEAMVEEKDAPQTSANADKTVENQAYFQITGMENWDEEDEDEEGEDGADAEAEEEEEDEFVTAFEILDMARVLLEKQLASLKEMVEPNESSDKGKGKAEAVAMGDKERHVKERLSDIHDLEAEIALEGERFLDAIPDTRAALALKKEIYEEDNNLVAEAYFKLSLALEFAAMTKIREAQAQDGESAKVSADDVDETLRQEAKEQQEHAIASCNLRLLREEKALQFLTGEEKEKQVKSIADVKEIIEEMETRVRTFSLF